MNIVGIVGAVVVLSLLAVLTVTGVVLYYNPLLCLRGRDWFLLPGGLSLTCLSLPVCWSKSGLPVPCVGSSPPHLCLCMGLPVTMWGGQTWRQDWQGLSGGTAKGAVSNTVSLFSPIQVLHSGEC